MGWRKMPLGRSFVEDLNSALQQRHIARGAVLLDRAEPELVQLGPETPAAGTLLLLLAQWVDAGYRDYHLVESLLANFPARSRRKLATEDYVRVRMAEAFRDFATEKMDAAIDTLDFVLRVEQDLPDESLASLAHFWKGRALRKKGAYEAAYQDIVRARELSHKARDGAKFTAVIQIQEGWLLFQKGLRKEAWRLLAHAESILKATDHYTALGNIESARGRIVRRSGEYSKALVHFERAVAIYSQGDPKQRNVARTLVNAAYVKRLLALQLRRRIEGRARGAGNMSFGGRGDLRARYQQISDEAIVDLQRAQSLYTALANQIGFGNATFNLGYVHLDRGEMDRAALEGAEAYRIGLENEDRILMARARILQAATENARVEEQIEEDVDLAVHANLARQYSEEALELAQHTQNRRLHAAACIARGMTAANDFFQDWDTARRFASDATDLIGQGDNDHLVDDLATLKSKVVRASGINDALRGWSEGMVGDKTFQQITEEFAEIVIPKVWLREGKKISRVAECLSVSPKKVRRILRNAGLLTHG